MDVQLEKTGSYLRRLSVSISIVEVESAFDKALRKVTKETHLPGFRPGKVPRSLIERQFGPQIQKEVQTQLVEDSLFKAMTEQQLAPVAMPRVQLGYLHRGSQFSYTAEVEIRPDISLQKYTGLALPEVEAAVEESAVRDELEAMRKQSAQLVPVLVRDTVQEGDVVQLDYVGTLDDQEFEGGSAENALVEVGGSGYIPGFAEGLVGAKVPGTCNVPVTFPEDYSAKHLAGRQAIFAMTLKELKERELPALDEEFAKDMGADSLAALEAKARGELQAKKDQEANDQRRNDVLKALVEANPFDVPPSMVTNQAERIVANARARIERMVGESMPINQQQLTDLLADSRDNAEFQVRSGLLLLEVGKAEKLEVTQEEVTQEIENMAGEANEQADALRSYYDEPERFEELQFHLLEEKVVKFLLEKAEIAPAAEATST